MTDGDRPGPSAVDGSPKSQHLDVIDVVRGLAAVVIALHHIYAYGPLPDLGGTLLPEVCDDLWLYARLTVQIFFVVSGFVTALTLSRSRFDLEDFVRFTLRRYIRLAAPYLATIVGMLILGVLIPARLAAFPLYDDLSWQSLLAHVFFLQDILGHPNLSTGFWYLSIDFQFGLLFGVLLLVHQSLVRLLRVRSPRIESALLVMLSAPCAVMSVFAWNTNAEHDVWLSYYFGSLYVGVLCGWAFAGKVPRSIFGIYAGIVGIGLIVEWRDRLALALATGLLLDVLIRSPRVSVWAPRTPWRGLGQISYSLFLVHYPTSWAVQSLGMRLWGASPILALVGMAVSFLVSLAVAVAMYRLVERPSITIADRFRRKKRTGLSPS